MPHPVVVAAAQSGPDIGSWADWVSGTGSLLAVAAAVIIAWNETRRSRKADQERQIAETVRDSRTRGYLLALVTNLKEVCGATAAKLADMEADEHVQVNRYNEWLRQVREADERLSRLSQFPSIPLELYLECDRVRAFLAERNFPARVRKTSCITVEDIAEKLESAEQRITGRISGRD